MTEGDWKHLLRQIRGGYVVPVLGTQLFADRDGASTVQRLVAQRLLDLHEIAPGEAPTLTPFHELNDAVTFLLMQTRVKAQALYVDVAGIYADIAKDPAAVPESIRLLAEITDFRLFVTMSADTLLADCLGARRGVREVIHAPRMPTDEWRDLPSDWGSRPGSEANILYMFGKARAAPVFAIHDEDVLEYSHNLMARGSNVPINFLRALQDRSLLLLGCGLPDWLGRFFLRLTNRDRLSEKSRHEWLIEAPRKDDELSAFLGCFSEGTQYLQLLPPAQFVAELHRRWLAEVPQLPAGDNQKLLREPAKGPVFFISYSRSADEPRALRLYQALRDMGAAEAEVWFDRRVLESGDEFSREIETGIRSCQYFLPLISEDVLQREEAYVFREWRSADERRQGMNRTFVVPVVVDDAFEPYRYDLPVKWAGLDFGHAPSGNPDPRMLNTLRDLLRNARNPARA